MTPDLRSHFDEVHAITCKAVRQIPDEHRDFRPVPQMMTAFDLIFHMFSQERVMLAGCRTGKLAAAQFRAVEEEKNSLRTIEDLARYGEQVHSETRLWVAAACEDEMARRVETFAGPSTPANLLYSALEHICHHRGQLYIYLRLLGIEPVFVWTGQPMAVVRQQFAQMA